MNELALFAGAGGGILGGHLLGWRNVCAVEFNAYARSVLLARQNDGTLAPFPIWDDVRTFDGRPWRGIVDVVSGGFPCQDISAAGRGDGLDGERSGLWSEMARIIGEVRPRFAFVENSPILTSRGLGRVLGDLASLGFNAEWGVLGADDVGAPHKRERIWILAHSNRMRELQPTRRKRDERDGLGYSGEALADSLFERSLESTGFGERAYIEKRITEAHCAERDEVSNAAQPGREDVANPERIGCQQVEQTDARGTNRERPADQAEYASLARWNASWPSESGLDRVVDGVAHRVDRLKAVGNGQVSRVAAAAFDLLSR